VITEAPDTSGTAVDVLQALADDDYRMGNLQAIPYNSLLRNDDHPLFEDNFLSTLYADSKAAGILPRTFCGMTNLSHDAIVSYLASKKVVALVEWGERDTIAEGTFVIAGYAFVVAWVGVAPPELGPRSAFAAYAYLPEYWGLPAAETLGMLGLAHLFHVYKLQSIFGQRYADNALTARFMARYGSHDIGTIPGFILDKGERDGQRRLIDCVLSRLTREDFVSYVERRLLAMIER